MVSGVRGQEDVPEEEASCGRVSNQTVRKGVLDQFLLGEFVLLVLVLGSSEYMIRECPQKT